MPVFVLGFFVFTLLFGLFVKKTKYPILVIVYRWLKWISFSLVFALFLQEWEVVDKPFFVLFSTAFLLWFLIESIYTWILVHMISQSEIPLFPRFFLNPRKEVWPMELYFFLLKEWTRKNGFRLIQSLKSNLTEETEVIANFLQDAENKIRLQVLFMPSSGGNSYIILNFNSITASNHRFITDNLNIPFGGIYPQDWFIARKPLLKNIQNLYDLHLERMKNSGEVFIKWETPPIDDISIQQSILERSNIDAGYIFPPQEVEENGRFTSEGRYRIWKQMWTIKYLGYYC